MAEKKKKKKREELPAGVVESGQVTQEEFNDARDQETVPEEKDKGAIFDIEEEFSSLDTGTKDAISFFLPQVIAGLGAGLVGGTDAALAASGEAERQMEGFRKAQLTTAQTQAAQEGPRTAARFQQTGSILPDGRMVTFDKTTGSTLVEDTQTGQLRKATSDELAVAKNTNSRAEQRLTFNKAVDLNTRKKTIINNFENDAVVKKAREGITLANRAKGLLQQGSPLAAGFAPRALGRLAGEVGVLTDQDVAAFKNPEIRAKVLDAINLGLGIGDLSPSTKKAYIEALDFLQTRAQRDIVEQGERIAGQAASAFKDISEEDIRIFLQLPPKKEKKKKEKKEKKPLRDAASLTEADIDSMTEEELDAFLGE